MGKDSKDRVLKSVGLFLGVFIFGVLGFMIVEGWNLIDAIYMTIITLSTVGYGETQALSDIGRVFTIILIVFGLGSAATVLNSFASIFLESRLNQYWGKKNMKTELKKTNNHVILCGLGQIGMIIAINLQEKNIPFVIVAESDEEIKKAEQMNFLTVEGDIASDATLHNAGITRAKTLVICLSDLTLNLSLSLAAKELNPEVKVIAQGVDTHLESRIIRAGADAVVYPLALGGEQISEIVAGGYGQGYQSSSNNLQIVQGYSIQMYRHFSSHPSTIKDVLKNENGLQAISYQSKSGEVLQNPNEEKEVFQDDGVIILVNYELEKGEDDESGRIPGKIEWNEKYSIGISSIDGEHLRLVQIINQFNESIRKGDSRAVIVHIFDRLFEYAIEHFENEEKMMKQQHYPDIEAHIDEHRKLLNTLKDLNKEKNYIFPTNVSSFLNNWLIDHILTTDMKYKEYFHK